ncbi:phosphotransferase enzyme family protein [Naviculisporaceae sp. PSN 640]
MPLEFTYRAASEELPAPLPTIKEIEASIRLPRRFPGSPTVYLLRPHFIIKRGNRVKPIESENMLFVRKHSDLGVPKLYAAFRDTETDKNYLIMEYIAGESVSRCWATLDQATKEAVVADLRKGLDQLRSIKSPGYFGNIKGQNLFRPDGKDSSVIKTAYEWTEDLLESGQQEAPVRPRRFEWFRRMYHEILDGVSDPAKAVFTHADLHMENILLREGDRKPFVIDWERAGFYPPYFEYQTTMLEERFATDWGTHVDTFLDPYPDQMFVIFHWRAWALFGSFCEPPGYESEPSQYDMSYWLDHLDDKDYGSAIEESEDEAPVVTNYPERPRPTEVADILEQLGLDDK